MVKRFVRTEGENPALILNNADWMDEYSYVDFMVKEAAAILIDRSRTDPFEKGGAFREVPVHFFYPEQDAAHPERFPLVIFSHGAFGYHKSNYSTYQELASNGYVVAALDHPHHG